MAIGNHRTSRFAGRRAHYTPSYYQRYRSPYTSTTSTATTNYTSTSAAGSSSATTTGSTASTGESSHHYTPTATATTHHYTRPYEYRSRYTTEIPAPTARDRDPPAQTDRAGSHGLSHRLDEASSSAEKIQPPDEPAKTGKKPTADGDCRHRFEIMRKLGSGTYGKVMLAYDHKTKREVAVKMIKKSAIENKQDLVRIKREIRIMSALKHPNVIEIYEVFENREKIIIILEYASGGELYDFVSTKGCLSETESRKIFREIVSAVLYCHKHKVSHRDLKLENILLDNRMTAKIADFGLSNYFGERQLLTTFCGSPLYASPEIINGIPYKGPEVDCWSLGVLLYTLVYGSMPFDGRDFNRMIRQIKRGAYYEPDSPSTASMLIRNMLRVNADRRADIYDIATHWWLNMQDGTPTSLIDLPENQVQNYTPLSERPESMVMQNLEDDMDIFMEATGGFGSATRRKIDEFRRRRKEVEKQLDQLDETMPSKRNKRNSEAKLNKTISKDDTSMATANKKAAKKSSTSKMSKTTSKTSTSKMKQHMQQQQQQAAKATPPPQADMPPKAASVDDDTVMEDYGHMDHYSEPAAVEQPAPPTSTDSASTTATSPVLSNGRHSALLSDDTMNEWQDPLSRLKALESRLYTPESGYQRYSRPGSRPQSRGGHSITPDRASSLSHSEADSTTASDSCRPMSPDVPATTAVHTDSPEPFSRTNAGRPLTLTNGTRAAPTDSASSRYRSSRPADSAYNSTAYSRYSPATTAVSSATTTTTMTTTTTTSSTMTSSGRSVEVDSINMLMSQLLESSEKGHVPPDLVRRIRTHSKFAESPFVKELLDQIMESEEKTTDKSGKTMDGSTDEFVEASKRSRSPSTESKMSQSKYSTPPAEPTPPAPKAQMPLVVPDEPAATAAPTDYSRFTTYRPTTLPSVTPKADAAAATATAATPTGTSSSTIVAGSTESTPTAGTPTSQHHPRLFGPPQHSKELNDVHAQAIATMLSKQTLQDAAEPVQQARKQSDISQPSYRSLNIEVIDEPKPPLSVVSPPPPPPAAIAKKPSVTEVEATQATFAQTVHITQDPDVDDPADDITPPEQHLYSTREVRAEPLKAWRAVSIEIEENDEQVGDEEDDDADDDGDEEFDDEEDEEEDTGEDIDMEECEAEISELVDDDHLLEDDDDMVLANADEDELYDEDEEESSEELLVTASAYAPSGKVRSKAATTIKTAAKTGVSRSEGHLLAANDYDNDSFVSVSSKATSHGGDSIVPPDPPASAPPFVNQRGYTWRSSAKRPQRHHLPAVPAANQASPVVSPAMTTADKLALLAMDRHDDSPAPRRFPGAQPDVQQADQLFERAKQYIAICPEYSETDIPVLEPRFRSSSRGSSLSPGKSITSPQTNASSQDQLTQWSEASVATIDSVPSEPQENISYTETENSDADDGSDVEEEEENENQENHYQIKQNIATAITLVAPKRSGASPSECSSEEVSTSEQNTGDDELDDDNDDEQPSSINDAAEAAWIRSHSSTISPIGSAIVADVEREDQVVDDPMLPPDRPAPDPPTAADSETSPFVLQPPPAGRPTSSGDLGLSNGVDEIRFADDAASPSSTTLVNAADLLPTVVSVSGPEMSPFDQRLVSPPRVFTFEQPGPSPTDTNRDRQSMSPPQGDPLADPVVSATRRSRDKRRRNRTLSSAESLFSRAAELLQRPFNSSKKSKTRSGSMENAPKEQSQSPDRQVKVKIREPIPTIDRRSPNEPTLMDKYDELIDDTSAAAAGRSLSAESRGERRASYRNAIDICAVPAPSVPMRTDQVADADEAADIMDGNAAREDGSDGRMDPFYQHVQRTPDTSLFNFVRPRINDATYAAPAVPAVRHSTAIRRPSIEEAVRKSSGGGYDPSSSLTAYVHQRDRSSSPTLAGYSSGRSAYQSSYHPDHRLTSRSHSRPRDQLDQSSAVRPASAHEPTSNAYRSKYDQNVSYRRSYYDVLDDVSASSGRPPTTGAVGSGTAPTSSAGGARKAIINSWNRSASLDAKPAASTSDAEARWNRLRSPEPRIGSSSDYEPSSPTIGIASQHDKETSPSRFRDWVSSGGSRFRPGKFMEKLKKHLSNEKLHRVAEEDYGSGAAGHSTSFDPTYQFVNGHIPPRPAAYAHVDDPGSYTNQVKAARKKRSILDMARRRTTELSPHSLRPRNSLPDTSSPPDHHTSTATAAAASSSSHRPFDRLKTFFRLSKENLAGAGATTSSNVTTGSTLGSTGSSGYSTGYTTGATTNASTAGYSPRKQYYKSRPVSQPMSGYSPGRYWYEDHSLY